MKILACLMAALLMGCVKTTVTVRTMTKDLRPIEIVQGHRSFLRVDQVAELSHLSLPDEDFEVLVYLYSCDEGMSGNAAAVAIAAGAVWGPVGIVAAGATLAAAEIGKAYVGQGTVSQDRYSCEVFPWVEQLEPEDPLEGGEGPDGTP